MTASLPIKPFFSSVFLILALSLSLPAQSPAQSQRETPKETALRDALKSISPSAVEPFKAGTEAMDKEDWALAITEFRKVLVKAPTFEAAQRRLGISLVESGQVDEGKPMLEQLVVAHRSPENLAALAQAVGLPRNGQKVSQADQERALELASDADRLSVDNDEYYTILVAQLALDLDQQRPFQQAVAKLDRNHPDLMQTHYFKAAEAAIAGKWVTAEQEIHRAEVLGLPHEVAQQFLAGKAVAESETETQSTVWRYAYYSLYAVAVWLAGLLLLFVSGKVLSGLTLHSIETDDPNDFGSKRHALLRKIYRVLINVGGFYYYISIPVVILLLLAVAGSVVYGSFMLGRIPIKLIAVIVIGALVTAFKMVQSLFVKLESGDPGRSIKVEEAPKLWDLARQVSGVVGTPVVDEIRMTPGTDLAVYQKSGSRRDSEDAGKKVLLVGAGILNGFSVNAFRAVLAHEYGHLSHRDTAGGEVALRVNANMRNFAIAMAQSGQAVWWNLGFWFLRIYHFIFRRLSYGATRLQEVLADRVAVLNYGAQAFEEGLRHVIRQSVEFEEAANSEIMSARQDRRTLRNLYGLEFATSPGVEDKVLAATNRSTTQDDTHPSPADRFRYASRIVSKPVSEIEGTVWDLFADREALTNEMSNTVNQRLRAG